MITKRLCKLFKLSIALIFLVSLVAISACSPEPEQKPKTETAGKANSKARAEKGRHPGDSKWPSRKDNLALWL